MMKDSLYEKYIKERQGLDGIWKEHGFLTYRISGEECFIVDMYIDKNARSTGLAKKMILEIDQVASKEGCKYLTGNVHLEDKNANNTLRAAQGCGFEVVKSGIDILLISKKIQEVSNG